MTGRVILVGAGPGDPGLLTEKGRKALEKAEVVVYDRLVSPAILGLIPARAERIDVGKESNHHPVPQERINEILLEKALEGKNVVRLKGGDPFLFGRGGEELELLEEKGVPFEVVPGVTSAISVPCYAGIPVTHRDYSSSLHIVTGHARAGARLDIDFAALCRMKGTLVFLMGVSTLPEICEGLLEAGMDGQMPAAVIQQGTLPAQKKCVSTLRELPQTAKTAGIQSPAVIVVGKVCAVSERLDWFEKLPMRGKRVIVTRPADRNGSLCSRIRDLGAEVLEYPCIRTQARIPADELDSAIEHISQYRWLVFTSPVGPKLFFDRLRAAGKDARCLYGCKIAAIGPKTAQTVSQFGLTADLVPAVCDSEHLAEAMAEGTGPVLLCRASQGSDALPRLFAEKNIPFTDAPCYDTVYESPDPSTARAWLAAPVIVSFTSASTVRGFAESLPGGDFSRVTGCCIGRQTAREAEKYGISVVVSREATVESLIDCIKEVK